MHWQGIRLFKGWISMIYDNENKNENILQNTVGSCACLSVPGDLLCDVFNGT